MPVFRLGRKPIFPDPRLAEPDGLLAFGGDLSVQRLLEAYRHGIFPWYEAGGPILWWSPDPRLVLFPEELRVSARLLRTIRQGRFKTQLDTAFAQVIAACAATPRVHEEGTWITPEMQQAYLQLHHAGFAHSLESWQDGRLVGGIYGVAVGRCFCGESMFYHVTDASKVALVALVERLRDRGFTLLDCQIPSQHLIRFGARTIPRAEFLQILRAGLDQPADLTGP
jgi:leucyl/phenylalanyl-tRNA--protein transferase